MFRALVLVVAAATVGLVAVVAVVPMLTALLSAEPTLQIVNVPTTGGLVEERQAWVSESSIDLIPIPAVGPEVSRWLKIYRAHEQALYAVVRHPCLETITEALVKDPVVSPDQAIPLANQIWENLRLNETGQQV